MKEQAASLSELQSKVSTLTESHKTALKTNQQLRAKVREASAKATSAQKSATQLQNAEAGMAQRLAALKAAETALRSEHEESLARLQASARTASANEERRAGLEAELGKAKANVKRLMATLDAKEAEHAAAIQQAKVYPQAAFWCTS